MFIWVLVILAFMAFLIFVVIRSDEKKRARFEKEFSFAAFKAWVWNWYKKIIPMLGLLALVVIYQGYAACSHISERQGAGQVVRKLYKGKQGTWAVLSDRSEIEVSIINDELKPGDQIVKKSHSYIFTVNGKRINTLPRVLWDRLDFYFCAVIFFLGFACAVYFAEHFLHEEPKQPR